VYVDGRRPETLTLGVALEEDLARRDFTINAMALPAEAVASGDWERFLIDPFGGREDLATGTIRAVGEPLERFREDGLRCLRACRFASQLGFAIEDATLAAIPMRLEVAGRVSVERAMTELTKLLCGQDPGRGLSALAGTGLLGLWLPELLPMIGCLQNRYHVYPVWEHTLEVVRRTPADPGLRWAGLLHDCGKPARRSEDAQGHIHFYGHEPVSMKLAGTILARLRASNALVKDVLSLVAHHGTHPGPDWGDPACRRFLKRLQEDGLPLERWGAFRLADQSGKGFGDETCLLEHLEIMARLEALAKSAPALNVRSLALDGRALMALAGRKAGPWMGELQGYLLERVLDDPGLNEAGQLQALAEAWLKT
jgi:tRNA nucleotidyltransferase/poly(A) polymerase